MKAFGTIIILAGIILLNGCDEAPKSKIKNPLAGQVQTLEKAKDIERQVLEAAEKERKIINEMTK